MTTRRKFITLLGSAAAMWPVGAKAQQPIGRTGKTPRVGILMPGPVAHSAGTLEPFYRGLHELGYIEGQNLAVEQRNGDWNPDRFAALATEFGWIKGRHTCRLEHADSPRSQAGDELHPDRRRCDGRPSGRRTGRKSRAAGR